MSKSISRRQIAASAGRQMVDAALSHAAAEGWEIAAAVVDRNGDLVAFGRTDDASPPIGRFAMDKAFTAGTLRKSTKAFGARMASSASLSLGLSNRDRMLAWGGGVAIFEGTACLGGLGVSGAQEHEDIACAEAAIRAIGLTPG